MERLFISFENQPDRSLPDAEDEQLAAIPIFGKIVRCLQQAGIQLVSGPAKWDSYGWYVEARSGNATLTCMFQRSDEWLLQIFAERGLLDRLTGAQYNGELHAFARVVAKAVHEAFGVPVPAIQSEAEFLR